MEQENILGYEKIGKLLFKLSIPAMISQVVNMLYNIVDRIYIGHIEGVGVQALTGVGLCFPILLIVSSFSALFGMSGAPQAAIEMGKGDNNKAERILGNCTTALVLTAFVLTGVLLIWGKELLFLFGASDNTVKYALDYMSIYAIGTVFVQISLGLNLFLTTQGFATYSMATTLIGAIINIILDPIFIYGLNMGVKGAALATVISQAISATWVLYFLLGKKTMLKIRLRHMRLNPSIILPVMALGLSPFVMQATESITNICFNVSLQKYGGDLAVGAMTILASIMSMCFMPLQGISQGSQPIISYNYGAKKMDRVKLAIKLRLNICLLLTFVCWAVIMMFPKFFIGLFNDDPALVEISVWSMRIYLLGLCTLGMQIPRQQTFVALGHAKVSLFLACLRKLILLIPLIFILPNMFEDKVFAVFLAEPIADITAATITVIIFSKVIKKTLNEREELDNLGS